MFVVVVVVVFQGVQAVGGRRLLVPFCLCGCPAQYAPAQCNRGTGGSCCSGCYGASADGRRRGTERLAGEIELREERKKKDETDWRKSGHLRGVASLLDGEGTEKIDKASGASDEW